MARPSKPLALVRKHTTKAEKRVREEAEKALVTGEDLKSWPEVRADRVAFSHYRRLYRLYHKIGKHDALIENVINRYCLLCSECVACEAEDKRIQQLIDKLEEKEASGGIEFTDYVKAHTSLAASRQRNQATLQAKRRMLLDIEKENLMTLAAQLRSIPKKPTEQAEDPMSSFLNRRVNG